MFGIIICIAAGAAMSIQGVMNTRLGESIGTSEANAFVQATAAVLALGVLIFHRDGSFSALGETNWLYMLGGVLGLVISVGIILLTVLLDNKIHTEDDVAKYLDLAVVGVIPEYQGGKKK